MKLCFKCDQVFSSDSSNCPGCGYEPLMLNGVAAYAPEYAYDGGGFKSEYFEELAKLEASSFWFRARNELIRWALHTYYPGAKSFLEVGCGTGFVLSGIAEANPYIALSGSEIFLEGLSQAIKRVPTADFMQMDARRIPFVSEFDAIGAFDVLEHIKEDEEVLSQLYKALRPGGVLLLTVPQHPWLWSATDEYACHVRRYTENDIRRKVLAEGFVMERSTSFVSLLLPAMLLSRRKNIHSTGEYDMAAELKLPKVLNECFYAAMKAEQKIIKFGANFPLGGSRLVVARKEL